MALIRFLYTLLLTYVAILIVGLFATVGALALLICLWGAGERAFMPVWEYLCGKF